MCGCSPRRRRPWSSRRQPVRSSGSSEVRRQTRNPFSRRSPEAGSVCVRPWVARSSASTGTWSESPQLTEYGPNGSSGFDKNTRHRSTPRLTLNSDDGLVGKSLEQVNLLSREWCRRFPSDGDQAEGPVSAYHRNHQPGLVPREARVFDIARARIRVVLNIRQVKHTTSANSLSGVNLGVERCRVFLSKPLDPFGPCSVSCGDSDHVPVDDEDRATQGRTHTDPASGDRLENGLRVCRRTSDDPEDLTGCRLPLQGLLRLGEQPHILYGDHSLVGKCFEQSDLFFRERLRFGAADDDGT